MSEAETPVATETPAAVETAESTEGKTPETAVDPKSTDAIKAKLRAEDAKRKETPAAKDVPAEDEAAAATEEPKEKEEPKKEEETADRKELLRRLTEISDLKRTLATQQRQLTKAAEEQKGQLELAAEWAPIKAKLGEVKTLAEAAEILFGDRIQELARELLPKLHDPATEQPLTRADLNKLLAEERARVIEEFRTDEEKRQHERINEKRKPVLEEMGALIEAEPEKFKLIAALDARGVLDADDLFRFARDLTIENGRVPPTVAVLLAKYQDKLRQDLGIAVAAPAAADPPTKEEPAPEPKARPRPTLSPRDAGAGTVTTDRPATTMADHAASIKDRLRKSDQERKRGAA